MWAFVKEFFTDLYRFFKLLIGAAAIPVLLYLILLWTGVLH